MIEVNLVPHDGAIMQNKNKIHFGQTTKEVRETFGEPTKKLLSYYLNGFISYYDPAYSEYLPSGTIHANNEQYFYDELEIRIDFDADKKVEFIECIAGPFPEKANPLIYGKDVFKLLAKELLELLLEKNSGDINIESREKIYSFLEIDVGIFRDMSEADAKEMIEEAKSEGIYEINKENHEYELRKACHFWTIGIGCEGYYRKTK